MPKSKGKHPHNALNATSVRQIKTPGRFADGHGLHLVVDQTGNKRWILRIVVQGKRRDIGIGGWPTVSLADARTEALRMRQIARIGGNPIADRNNARVPTPTFADASKTVHEEHKASWKNAKHQAQWITTLEHYAFPRLGNLPVDRIGTAEVVETLLPIWLSKPETARRLRQRIGTVLDWAKAKGYREHENPVTGVLRGLPKQSKQGRHHASLPYPELPSFLTSLRAQTSNSSILALEFLILTATRTSEVLLAHWNEIDLASREWNIPAERMKAKRDFRVPLSDRAIVILEKALSLRTSSDFVFPGNRTGKPLSQMALLMILRRMQASVTAHGFRSTFRNWAAERTNFAREVCESALAHTVQNKTEAAYLRTDLLAKRRRLMDAWSNFATQTAGEVVSLPRIA